MDLNYIKNNMVQVILQFSIPFTFAMVLTSMISITDDFFIGNNVGMEEVI